ncbi:hypothetical protein HMPREF0541_01181 [Lacticaseibacillus rhamnosus ATCC 21052]|nr:hypothetical protein HMPREF0541_01181 [Lacticaseibacillus rhamnosus ATCC 21052]
MSSLFAINHADFRRQSLKGHREISLNKHMLFIIRVKLKFINR